MASRAYAAATPKKSSQDAAIEAGFLALEAATGYPQLQKLVGGTALSLAAIPAAKALAGANLLQGQTLAQVVFGSGTSAVTVKANRPGVVFIDIVLTDAASASASISGTGVTGDHYIITANYRGATHSNTDKATDVAALINGQATAKTLVTATGGGSGNVTAATATALAGGISGESLSVKINNVEQDIVGTMTETSIPMVTKGSIGANGDAAVLEVISKGRRTHMTVGVVT